MKDRRRFDLHRDKSRVYVFYDRSFIHWVWFVRFSEDKICLKKVPLFTSVRGDRLSVCLFFYLIQIP